jgi:hypothetical protein
MGGFLLYINHTPRGPLTPHELFHCVRRGYIDMPAITQEEIEDKQKRWLIQRIFCPSAGVVRYTAGRTYRLSATHDAA